ncbi:MAG: ComF family protein [Actinomycetota bacterium]
MSGFIDLVLPASCAACGSGEWPICGRCAPEVAVASPPWCARCGRPTEEPIPSCSDCPPPPIQAARAPFLYEGPIARALKALKFSGWRALGHALAPAMVEVCDLDAEVVTWVPLAARRRARRGFDQAEVLARVVAPKLGVQVRNLLRRVRETPPQARRSAAERRRGLRGAFIARASSTASIGSVLLVDDVLTTGATSAACARALQMAGARRVVVLTLARSLPRPAPARCYGIP